LKRALPLAGESEQQRNLQNKNVWFSLVKRSALSDPLQAKWGATKMPKSAAFRSVSQDFALKFIPIGPVRPRW
jgi:hypothetical protein